MSLETLRTRHASTRHALASFVLALFVSAVHGTPASAQTAEPTAKPAPDKPPVVEKSKRLDKHAGPWTVIWNTRLWTDVPETKDFVKATHPDPKKLEYAPLVGTEPARPKPRDAAGIAALQAELEGDIKRNEARGKAINDVSAPKAKAEKPRRSKRATRSAHDTRASKAN